ncbi:MAG: glutamate formimidoyltransferase [Deltaproteobacteria bacterium]|jgi:glutamate formiminotransferase/formiminotetrahydrofolate cyclodeaminase|nr:glutamate formimidoyltransferase [Deltaproteobacteria bacterium]
MSGDKQYVLAVPNFSEGQDAKTIEAVTNEVKGIAGVKLVSVEPERDFNRTVVTIIGEPGPLKKALVKMGTKAAELIDMSKHKGTHPRIGAEDTLPIFPLHNITIEECRALAEEIGKEFFENSKVPVFFAGVNARTPDRSSFAFLRAGQYEGLRDLLKEIKGDPKRLSEYDARKPDFSTDGLLSDKAGGTIVSCEADGLTAYNIFLDTEELAVAKAIAKAVRGPSGGFGSIRAVGVKFPEHKGVVVSMNMFDCINLPIQRVFEFCQREARRFGVNVTGSQLVGPIKLSSIVASFEYALGLEGFRTDQILESHLIDL